MVQTIKLRDMTEGQLALFDRDIFCAYVSDYGKDWTL